MIWVLLILGAVVAIPLLIERQRITMDDTARGSAPGSFAELTHGTTHFEWFGPARGPVAVCIHGLTTPSFVWRGILRGLAVMGFRVLIYDLYGRGYSDRPGGPQDRALFIDQLNDLLDHEEVGDDLTLIGYSMGGAIATAFAASDPGRVRQLILLAPAIMGASYSRIGNFIAETPILGDWLMLGLYPTRFRRDIRAEAAKYPDAAELHSLQESQLEYRRFIAAVLGAMRGILAEDLKNDHQKLHAEGTPVLAIWGGKDTVIPTASIGALTKWSRAARQEVIQDAGHGLPYTHTEDVLRILQRHLRGEG